MDRVPDMEDVPKLNAEKKKKALKKIHPKKSQAETRKKEPLLNHGRSTPGVDLTHYQGRQGGRYLPQKLLAGHKGITQGTHQKNPGNMKKKRKDQENATKGTSFQKKGFLRTGPQYRCQKRTEDPMTGEKTRPRCQK